MIDRRWAIPVAIALFGSVCYYVGKNTGRSEEKLAQNTVQTKASDKHTDSVQIRTSDSRKHDALLDSAHDVIRTRVRVYRDTVYVQGEPDSTDEAIYSPAIARLIASDDSLISAQKHFLALSDTLIASLRVGISLRDQRIKLLESRGASRISRGIQLGVGYCATQNGNTPCIYAGYGLQIKLP